MLAPTDDDQRMRDIQRNYLDFLDDEVSCVTGQSPKIGCKVTVYRSPALNQCQLTALE